MGAVQFLGFTGRPQVDFYTIDLKDGNKDPWLSQMHYTLNIGWNRGFDGIAGIEVEELAYIRPLRPEEELERLGRLALLPPSVMVVRLGADAQAVVAAERIMETRADEAIVVFLCSDNGSERVASNILERWVGRVSFDGSKVRAGVDSNTVTGAGASCLTDDAGVLCLFIRERNISWFPRPNLPSTVVKMPSPASDVQAALEFADLACKRWDRCNTKAVLSDATWRKIARELPSHPRPPLAPKLLFDWSSPSVVVDDARRVISIEGMKTVGILRQVLTGHIVSAKGGRRML